MQRTHYLIHKLFICLFILTSQSLKAREGLQIIPNQGQLADTEGHLRPDLLFSSKTPGANLYFHSSGFSYVLAENVLFDDRGMEINTNQPQKIHRVDVLFQNTNPNAFLQPEDPSEGYNNYYYSHCPDGVLNVPVYQKLIYKELYHKIDLVIYQSPEGFKYDFIIHPGGDPGDIQIEYKGAEGLTLSNNTLEVMTSLGPISESIPLAYQSSGSSQASIIPVSCDYILVGNQIQFEVSEWDSSSTLVIDPVSTWATFYGGSGIDYGRGVANDNFAYQAGETASSNFPVSVGAQQTSFGGNRDAYIVKWAKNGSRLWGTYYGGTGRDAAEDVAVDGSGNSYITGYAGSGFPTTGGAFQPAFTNGEDGFLVKFNSAGVRQWATYLGGEGDERALDVATDGSGNIVVAGFTDSNFQISTAGVVQTARSGNDDAFVMKFNSAGARLWGTYYGGSRLDEAHGITCDATGNVIFAGRTYGNFPVGSCCGNTAWQTVFGGAFGDMDMFVTKLNSTGTSRLWSTYYGGPNVERAYDVEVDGADNVIVAGNAWANFPSTFGTVQPSFGGGMGDAAVVKFNSSGTRLWATYLGGTSYDLGFSVDAVGTNDIIIGGETESFFTTVNQCQTTCSGTYCGFIVHLDGNGATRIMSTVLGGSGLFNSVLDVSVDGSSNIFTTGFTNSTNYPVGGASVFQPAYGGGSADAFMGIYNDDSCNAVILPVTIMKFDAKISNSGVELSWLTVNEINSDHFEVERKSEHSEFRLIGQENAVGKGDNSYHHNDVDLPGVVEGPLFYRLKTVDQNGTFVYSSILKVELPEASDAIRLFPNPADDKLMIEWDSDRILENIVVFDLAGRELSSLVDWEENENGVLLNVLQLPKGAYILQMLTSEGPVVRKFYKQ